MTDSKSTKNLNIPILIFCWAQNDNKKKYMQKNIRYIFIHENNVSFKMDLCLLIEVEEFKFLFQKVFKVLFG